VFLDHGLGIHDAERVHIADRDEAGVVLAEDAGHVHAPADAAAADLQDVDLVGRRIRTEDARRNDGRESDGGTGEAGNTEKITAGVNGWGFHGSIGGFQHDRRTAKFQPVMDLTFSRYSPAASSLTACRR
jgi:hypothetical protein